MIFIIYLGINRNIEGVVGIILTKIVSQVTEEICIHFKEKFSLHIILSLEDVQVKVFA